MGGVLEMIRGKAVGSFLTENQRDALEWLEEIKEKHSGGVIVLDYIDDYWRTCPIVYTKDGNKVVFLGKVHGLVWSALVRKGYFKEVVLSEVGINREGVNSGYLMYVGL